MVPTEENGLTTLESDNAFKRLDLGRVSTPCYVLDVRRLERNLVLLREVANRAGIDVLLALKAFACPAVGDLVSRYLDGTAASGLYEARLGASRFGGEVSAYAVGLKASEVDALAQVADHVVLNSLNQLDRFGARLLAGGATDLGLRINPLHREVDDALYDPCAPWSRLGVPATDLAAGMLEPFAGVMVHGLCDNGFEAFERFSRAVVDQLMPVIEEFEWLNLGGGLLITSSGFPVDALVERLLKIKQTTGRRLILEPGTAVALNAGALITEVIDVASSAGRFAIVDASATCHAPDVIEAGYTPDLLGANAIDAGCADACSGTPGVVRIGGGTCLAGDVFGTYRMDAEPTPGDRLAFLDLAYYTMVKSSSFNGMPLPSIALWDPDTDDLELIKSFGYNDFAYRLG